MEHLLQASDWAKLTRPSSVNMDEDDINLFIKECEDIYIIPAIGDDLFLQLCAANLDDKLIILLDGGQYTDNGQKKHIIRGIRTALAYFVYAKMAKNDGAVVGRSGFMQHNDKYSARMDDKNRVNKYNDCMNVAEKYLSDCLNYMKFIYGKDNVKPIRGSRVRFLAIGD